MVDQLVENLFHYTPTVFPAVFFIILHIFIIFAIAHQTYQYYVNQRTITRTDQLHAERCHVHVHGTSEEQLDLEQGHHPIKPTPNTPTNTQAKTWERHGIKLLWIVAGTATCLIIGLGLRIQMLADGALITYIIQQSLLIISPNALAFVNYSLLGLIIRASEAADPTLVTSQPFYLRSHLVARVFLLSDVFAFVVQSSASPMLANGNPDMQHRGNDLMIGGLFIQLTFFTLFCCISIYVNRNHKYVSTRPTSMNPLFNLLYFTIICLYIRSIYRTVEFITGYDGPVARLEWMFYVLDMVPVTLAMACYAYFKPQGILQLAQHEVEMTQNADTDPRTPIALTHTSKTVIVASPRYGSSLIR